MENYNYKGNKKDVIKQLSGIMSREDAIKFLRNLDSFTDCLDVDEKIEIKVGFPSSFKLPPGCDACIAMDTNFFINLKASTIVLMALILDITFTKGFANAIVAATGISLKAITRLSNNEKCFVKEALKNKSREFECAMFFQCRNNVEDCEYSCGNRCGMTELEIQKTLDNLVAKNVFKIKRGKYICNR